MNFKIDLGQTERFPELPLRYKEELDDVRSILSDICEALADTSSADFIVTGFGQERWPVDVRTDLPVFLEQLPKALTSVELGSSFSLDFYEQGIERIIHFECTGDEYSARCESQTDWKPQPAIETISRLELRKMLSDVRQGLMQILLLHAPRVAAHPWVRDWAGVARD